MTKLGLGNGLNVQSSNLGRGKRVFLSLNFQVSKPPIIWILG